VEEETGRNLEAGDLWRVASGEWRVASLDTLEISE
jgi:hypothetical protein